MCVSCFPRDSKVASEIGLHFEIKHLFCLSNGRKASRTQPQYSTLYSNYNYHSTIQYRC